MEVLLHVIKYFLRCQIIQITTLHEGSLKVPPLDACRDFARASDSIVADEAFDGLDEDIFVLLVDNCPTISNLTNQVLEQIHRHRGALWCRCANIFEHCERDLQVIWRELIGL